MENEPLKNKTCICVHDLNAYEEYDVKSAVEWLKTKINEVLLLPREINDLIDEAFEDVIKQE